MPSTPSPLLRLELQTTGENVNSWGDKLNGLFTAVEQATASILTLAITGDRTLTTDNYVSNEYRRHALILTGSPAADFTLTVPKVSYPYRIANRTGRLATIKTTDGAAAIVRAGMTTTVLCDGTDCTALDPTLDQIKTAAGPVSLGSQKITGQAAGTALTDGATLANRLDQFATPLNDLLLGGFRITNQGAGTGPNDSATLSNRLDQFASATSPITIPNATASTHAVNLQQLQAQVFSISATPAGSAVGQVPRWTGSSYSPGAVDLTSVNAVAGALPLANGGTAATSAAGARTSLGLGTAATQNVGTTAGNVVQLDGNGRLPAVDGRNLTNIPLKIIDRAYAESTAFASLSVTIPYDNTIPQSNEGTQILSASITPKSLASILRARIFIPVSLGDGVATATAAMFVNASTSALFATRVFGDSSQAANSDRIVSAEFEFLPNSNSAQSISVRVGASSGAILINGNVATGTRMLGGVMRATLIVEEIAP